MLNYKAGATAWSRVSPLKRHIPPPPSIYPKIAGDIGRPTVRESVKMSTENRTNWGRWGGNDQRGMLNLLTPERVKESFGLASAGKVYSLGAPVGRDGPVHASRNTSWHLVNSISNDLSPDGGGGADDVLVTQCHASTHIDSLAHVWHEGELFNGHSADYVTPEGAQRCGVENIGWVISRGVMLDIPKLKGLDQATWPPRRHTRGIRRSGFQSGCRNRFRRCRAGTHWLVYDVCCRRGRHGR